MIILERCLCAQSSAKPASRWPRSDITLPKLKCLDVDFKDESELLSELISFSLIGGKEWSNAISVRAAGLPLLEDGLAAYSSVKLAAYKLERIPVTWKRSLHVGSNWCILAG
jgi:hypothetical protein